MSNFRSMLLSTAAAGLVAVAVSPAAAGEVEKSMSVSGHINRAVVVTDNGENTTVSQIDTTNVSGSRFRIKGAAKSESMTISTLMELGVQRNGSIGSHSTGGASVNIRHSVISISSDMGTVKIGHTTAADGYSTSNSLSGAGGAGFYDGHAPAGEEFRVKGNTGTAASGVTQGTVMANFISGRKNNIQYNSPKMSGFSVNVGFANNDHGAAKLNYSGDFDGTKVIATAAIGSNGSSAIDKQWGGSVAVALSGGLTGSVAYSRRDLSNATANAGLNDPEMWGAAIGYKMGANGINLWYQNVDDLGANGNEATAWALVAQHNLSAYGASIYGGIENTEYDTIATKYDDLTSGWVGIKVTF